MCSCVCDLQVLNTTRLEVLGVLLEDLQALRGPPTELNGEGRNNLKTETFLTRKFSEKLVENLVKNLLKKCYLGKKCNLGNFQRKIFENTKSGMPVVSLLC